MQPGTPEPAPGPSAHGAVTRGFLFSDLRDYTAFVDRHGAAAAADLLARYRALVRAAIGRHAGAEIKTEGDSFYVVFDSVSDALRAGLEIVEAARSSSDESEQAIRVGVGIHAGETLETSEGYVGRQVNVAARLCSAAASGEVLVSDTVRSLTEGTVAVRFVARGRRRLKGLADPIAVFASQPADATGEAQTRLRAGRALLAGVAITVGAIVVVAVVWALQRSPTAPIADWKIGLSVGLNAPGVASDLNPLRRAAELAVRDAQAGGKLAAYQLSLEVRDEGQQGDDQEVAGANAAALVADPTVVAMVGAGTSLAAERQIPITNGAGLLDCSPTTTDPRLTKPEDAFTFRSPAPTRINFVRLPALADIEAAADASFAFYDLSAKNVLLIDDGQQVGKLVADGFEREFEALGGAVVRRTLNPGSNPGELLGPIQGAGGPTLVVFSGFTGSGGPGLRQAMVAAGDSQIPLLSWDGLYDGSGAKSGSYIATAAAAAVGTYVSHPTVGTISADFEQGYRAAYGEAPDPQLLEYAAASHACVEVIVQSLVAVGAADGTRAGVREAVRAYAVNAASRFDTVVGSVGFDANGDSIHQVVSFYRVDPSAAGGAGDWTLLKQQDFGPPR